MPVRQAPRKARNRALGRIDHDLRQAVKILDDAARKIRDADLGPKRNIRRVGHALVHIFDIQEELHHERPDRAGR